MVANRQNTDKNLTKFVEMKNKNEQYLIVKFLLEQKSFLKRNDFQVNGDDFLDLGIRARDIKNLLFFFDSNDFFKVWIIGSSSNLDEADVLAKTRNFESSDYIEILGLERLKERPSFELKDSSKFVININEEDEKKLNEKGLVSKNNQTPNWKLIGTNSGELTLPNGEVMRFRGGNFGFLDYLISNFESGVKREDLQTSYLKYTQRTRNGKRGISDIRKALKRDRPLFFKFFDIQFLPPSTYKLVFVN